MACTVRSKEKWSLKTVTKYFSDYNYYWFCVSRASMSRLIFIQYYIGISSKYYNWLLPKYISNIWSRL